MATDMIARALAAKAMQEAAGGGTEQFIVTVTDDKSDKTPAEIAEAVKAGKQVVLQDNSSDVVRFCYLVNAGNDVATFCGAIKKADGTAELDPIFGRVWFSILNDQTVIYTEDFNVPFFSITKDDNGKYTSELSPEELVIAAQLGCAGNAFLEKDGEMFIGTISLESGQVLHIYFPDYAKGKLYDLMWNEDENPYTYTFTELSINGGLLTVNITKDSSTNEFVADKTYAEIVAAIESGKNVRCYNNTFGDYSSYYTYNEGQSVTFVIQLAGPYFGNKDLFMSLMIVFNITNKDEITLAAAHLPMPAGIPLVSERNKILKTNADGAMEYVDADTYLVKQPTSDKRGQFLSTDGNGNQVWADPLTAGNNDSVVIKSSTPNSTKKFRITVDDAGAITATEVV